MSSKRFRSSILIGAAVLIVLLTPLVGAGGTVAKGQGSPFLWWLVGSTLKISPADSAPDDIESGLHLHAARQEYAPFQVVFRTGDQPLEDARLAVDYPENAFDLTFYEESFLALPVVPEPGIFTLARLHADQLPDGLKPFSADTLSLPANSTLILWVDLYVRPDARPGDHTLTINVSGVGWRRVDITVYPVDLAPSAAMNVIIPLGDANWTLPFFGGDDPAAFLQEMHRLLLENDLLPGALAARPRLDANGGWDFTALDAELDALPPGATFYAPGPYDEERGEYLLLNSTGRPYKEAHFDDSTFADGMHAYFQALADYLAARDRLDGALIYPMDETRWLGDEPIHSGPAGFERLAWWTETVRAAGLRVRASGVTPVAPGPASFGWIMPNLVADDLHVPEDTFDAAPDLFAAWNKEPSQTTSLYLNEYGDLIDLPAALQRGMIWHAYAHGIRDIAGYGALEWVDDNYDLVNPWTDPDKLYPQSGYGGGALVWPGPLPSLRIKLLREGVEDARLLDLYAAQFGAEPTQQFASCLTPGALADQNPPADLWDAAHTELLVALSEGNSVSSDLCLTPVSFSDEQILFDFDNLSEDEIQAALDEWDFTDTIGRLVWKGSSRALSVNYKGGGNEAGYWLGESDWSDWDALEIEVWNTSPYFALLDVGLTDTSGHYVMLRNGAIILGPDGHQTLILPLVVPLDEKERFDWSKVEYISLQVSTSTKQTDAFGHTATYPLGPRTLVFDNFRLVRQ